MTRLHLTESFSLVIAFSLELLLGGFAAFGAFFACLASIPLLGSQCLDALEAGGRFTFHLALYGTALIIGGFVMLTLAATILTFFFKKAHFREGIPKRIRFSLIGFGLILTLFYLFAVFPTGQYCHISSSPLGALSLIKNQAFLDLFPLNLL
jgi:hypothetical protein